MGKGLLNYTTAIAADKTAGEIQSMLVKAGAKAIMTEYEEGQLVALRFIVPTQFGDRPFRLPADSRPVLHVLERQAHKGQVAWRYVEDEQAVRVAWRIVKSWLEAQLALIETEMVAFEQVMLPYMSVDGERTLYELMVESKLALPQNVTP